MRRIVELRSIVMAIHLKQPFFAHESSTVLENSNAGLIHEQGLILATTQS